MDGSNGPWQAASCDESRHAGDRLRTRTRKHYESFPFIQGGQERIGVWTRRSRVLIPQSVLGQGDLVLDVGSSTGEVAAALRARGAEVVCLDLTHRAMVVAKQEHGLRCCQGDALCLPFRDASFDVTIAVGVLHHTPNCRRGILEMARVTRPGGGVIVFLYGRYTPYHMLYRLAAPLRKWVPARMLNGVPSWVMGPISSLLSVAIGQSIDYEQTKRLLADQVWTPQASFHTARQVREWARIAGLEEPVLRVLPAYGFWLRFSRSSTPSLVAQSGESLLCQT